MTTTRTDLRHGVSSGTAVKAPCKAATTAAITLAGEQTVDGVALVTGDRCLVKDQASGSANGIYTVDTGAWTRAKDVDGVFDVKKGTFVYVHSGTTNTGFWFVSTSDAIVPGTTSLTFARASSILAEISAFAQTLLDDTSAGAFLTTLGVSAFVQTLLNNADEATFRATAGAVGLTGNETVAGNKTLSGSTVLSGSLAAAASVAVTGDITPTQLTGDQNDYNPTGLSTASVLRLSSDASRTITGLQGGSDGRIVVLVNVGSFPIVLSDDSASSTAANRFSFPSGNLTLATDDTFTLIYDSTTSRWRVLSALPRQSIMAIAGLTYAQAADTDHDTTIAVGVCRDGSNAHDMTLESALTKRIDAAWAVGTNAGGLDGTESVAGTPDANTWYFIWLIKRADTGVVDALYSESATSPTMPTNYSFKRLIGMVKTDGSANILAYSTMELTGGGLEFLWSTPSVDVNTTEDATANTRTLGGVPTGVKTIANLFHAYTNTNANDTSTRVSALDADDVAPSATTATTHYVADGAAAHGNGQFIRVRTDTSAQVRTRIAAAAGTVNIVITTIGWEWSRR